MENFTDIPLSAVIKAVLQASKRGFAIDDDKSLEENYNDACELLFEKQERLTLIRGSYTNHGSRGIYLEGELPLCGHYWIQGELAYNQRLDRYEERVQDWDGTCYLLIG